MGSLVQIISFYYDNGTAVKEIVPKTDYYSVRLIKIPGYTNPLKDSNINVVLLNGKCFDKETRCLYLFYIDTFFLAAWIIEINIDTRVQTVVYYDPDNNIGFDPDYKIYNPRVVHGRLVWTDNKNAIYQMDISRAKRSFFYNIGYDPYPNTSEWNSVRTYGSEEIVSRGRGLYKCIENNSSQDPGTSTGYWEYLCPIQDAYYSMKIENFYFAPKPPMLAPIVIYESDPERQINNLKQTLFQFAYNYVYMDYRESTFSPACIVALPQSEEEIANGFANEDISVNNKLKITVNTGGEEVRSIRIIGRSNVDPSVWFLVGEINKFEEEGTNLIGVDSINSGLKTTDKITLSIIIPQPIVTGTSITLSGYKTLEISAKDATASNYYILASEQDMSWTWDEFIT